MGWRRRILTVAEQWRIGKRNGTAMAQHIAVEIRKSGLIVCRLAMISFPPSQLVRLKKSLLEVGMPVHRHWGTKFNFKETRASFGGGNIFSNDYTFFSF